MAALLDPVREDVHSKESTAADLAMRELLRPLVLSLAFAAPLAAQQFVAELDAAPGRPIAAVNSLLAAGNGIAYFRGSFPGSGSEIGVSDGSAAGTRMFAELQPGNIGSNAQLIGAAGSRVLASWGSSVLIADGTPFGTVVVRNVGTIPPTFQFVGTVGSRFLWTERGVFDGVWWRLWSSDGTPSGTIQLASLLDVVGAVVRNGRLLISADAGGGVLQLLSTDGVVMTPIAGLPNSGRSGFAALGSFEYFVVDEPGPRWALWRTDGTAAGTSSVFQLGIRGNRCSIARCGNRIVVATGYQVWFSDGTPAGTAPLPLSFNNANLLVAAGNVATFADTMPASAQQQVWRTDGTVAGTYVVDSVPQSYSSSISAGSNAYFLSASTNPSLLRTDGTVAGTVSMGLVASTDRNLVASGNDVLTSMTPSHLGTVTNGSLYRTDGTPAGTTSMMSAPVPGGILSHTRGVAIDRSLIFTASTLTTGGVEVLWRTDGTASGTQPVGGAVGTSGRVLRFQGAVWFASGGSIWRYSGASGQSVRVLTPHLEAYASKLVAASDDFLLFSTTSNSNGMRVWRSDGTPSGTSLLYMGFSSETVETAVQIGGSTFFLHYVPSTGVGGIYRSNGSVAGTAYLGLAERWMAKFGDRAMFTRPTANGRDLYSLTENSVTAQFVAPAPMSPSTAFVVGSRLVCVSSHLGAFSTDGTTATGPLPFPNLLPPYCEAGGFVYAAASGAQGETVLWRTDGTPAGTQLAISFGPNGNVRDVVAVGAGNRLLLDAADGVTGNEPWISGGSQASTALLADLVPNGNSSPQLIGVAGERAYFAAFDPVRGRELWSFDLAAVGAAHAQPFGVGCAGSNGVPLLAVEGMPAIGRTLSLRLERGAVNSLGLWLLGFGPQRIPVGGGCEWLMTSVAWSDWAVTDTAGSAATSLSVPSDPVFVGLALVAQAACLDALAPAGLGITGSEGVLLVLGG